jgi:large subunit ribosomal protein L15
MPSELNLSNLKPAQKRTARKRIGRGMGSGTGRYAGRGLKGQKSRSGSHKMRPGFEGGQMPLYMRLGKQPGATSKDAMPIGPFRTRTQGVNVRDLERVFDAGSEVSPEALKAKRLIRSTRIDVKILGEGELTKKLAVSAHGFSRAAREKIEAAGGSAVLLREPKPKRRKRGRKPAAVPAETDVDMPASAEEPAAASEAAEAAEPDSGPEE